jgi:hypothetical protein
LISGLKTLAVIPTVRQFHLGILASMEKREVVDTSWDVSELLFFDDEAGQKTYQDHPIHQDFVKTTLPFGIKFGFMMQLIFDLILQLYRFIVL